MHSVRTRGARLNSATRLKLLRIATPLCGNAPLGSLREPTRSDVLLCDEITNLMREEFLFTVCEQSVHTVNATHVSYMYLLETPRISTGVRV
jgi:hypothetical protein